MESQQHNAAPGSIGSQIRAWRKRRRMSQLEFALEAEISQKHLSFIESGRAAPSREMVLRLAKSLNVPLREQNLLMLAAGFAPAYSERPLDGAAMAEARQAVGLVLRGHEPFPAIAVDRHWTLISANAAVAGFFALVKDKALLEPPVNVLKLSLLPGGLADNILNLAAWHEHVVERLKRQIDVSGDSKLMALHDELAALFARRGFRRAAAADASSVALALRLGTPFGQLNFMTATMVFGTPVDVTLSELAIEVFFPMDQETSSVMQRMGTLASAPPRA